MSEPSTKLPWRVRDDTLELVDSNGHRIFTPSDPYDDRHSDELEIYADLKDLQYIVEACNNYPTVTAQLAELQKPCVWTWDQKFCCWITSCSTSCTGSYEPNHMTYCPWCRKPIEEKRDGE